VGRGTVERKFFGRPSCQPGRSRQLNSLSPELSVVVFAVFFGQAPRSVVMTRICATLRAGLFVFQIEQAIEIQFSSLQCSRFFEATVSTLFHGPAPH
jgi:hypothetical protein